MTKEILQQFCGHYSYPWTARPFSIGEHTYATDVRVLIRVPRLVDVAENPEIPAHTVEKMLGYWKEIATDFQPLPVEPQERWGADCSVCDGAGATHCFICDGCSYEHELKTKIICESCDGSGKIVSGFRVPVGTEQANAVYLKKLAVLPNCWIACPLKPGQPFAIRFDGGTGFLMPMNPKEG